MGFNAVEIVMGNFLSKTIVSGVVPLLAKCKYKCKAVDAVK